MNECIVLQIPWFLRILWWAQCVVACSSGMICRSFTDVLVVFYRLACEFRAALMGD